MFTRTTTMMMMKKKSSRIITQLVETAPSSLTAAFLTISDILSSAVDSIPPTSLRFKKWAWLWNVINTLESAVKEKGKFIFEMPKGNLSRFVILCRAYTFRCGWFFTDVRVLPHFDIVDVAQWVDKAVVRKFNTFVKNNTVEIRFYWAGKGTRAVPAKGNYDFKPPLEKEKEIFIVVGVVALLLCLVFIILFTIWWKGLSRSNSSREQDVRGLDLQTGLFTFRQIKDATTNFDEGNKIVEGGFGSVYKGILLYGTVIAVKQLSSKSKQGNHEFVNEIGMISGLQHPNPVRLYDCCIERDQLLLVYEYMENNSIARALFGPEESQLELDWPTKLRICIGIARGLVFLHKESRLKSVHRDIKATNVLLDMDLNPKISNFGLAKLDEDENTHISTRIAGTIG